MKTFTCVVLIALRASAALAACNADNVLRALQRNAVKASSFCNTYTLSPPNQALPTFVSQYPATRIASGCSCLITTTPRPIPGTLQCSGELIRNGDFQTVANGGAPPWEFALPVNPKSGQEPRASVVTGADGNKFAWVSTEPFNR